MFFTVTLIHEKRVLFDHPNMMPRTRNCSIVTESIMKSAEGCVILRNAGNKSLAKNYHTNCYQLCHRALGYMLEICIFFNISIELGFLIIHNFPILCAINTLLLLNIES